jgi:hypothetical protein
MPLRYLYRHRTSVTTFLGGEEDEPIYVMVNNRGATREALIRSLAADGATFVARSDWHALSIPESTPEDWDYHSIVLHHAGNSHACAVPGISQMHDIEQDHLQDNPAGFPYHFAIDCLGAIFEGLDIRYRGEHLKGGNTNRIGIVFLADFSRNGEASAHAPSEPTGRDRLEGFADAVDFIYDKPTSVQVDAARKLSKALKALFPLKDLGGHTEYAVKLGDDRSCPGAFGLQIAAQLRQELGLSAP